MKKKRQLVPNSYIIIMLAFLYIPIMVMIALSFNQSAISSVWGGFSLDWYKTLFQRQDVIKAVWTTVRVTGISTLVSVSLATLGAIGFYKYDFKGKSLLDSMLYLPAVVPPLVLGIALFSLYNILHIQLGEPTIIIAHITFCTPFAFSTIKGTLDGFDHSIEDGSQRLRLRADAGYLKSYRAKHHAGCFICSSDVRHHFYGRCTDQLFRIWFRTQHLVYVDLLPCEKRSETGYQCIKYHYDRAVCAVGTDFPDCRKPFKRKKRRVILV